jgi:hypothetical protein
MAQPNPFAEQVEANLPKLDARPEFGGDRIWLTFYLMGPPENLQQVSEGLKARGWVNVDGWEGAFLHPKVRVGKSVEAVVRAAEATQELCALHGIQILNIDADTSPDVQRSQLVTLYRS